MKTVAEYWNEILPHDPCAEAVEWVAANPGATVDDAIYHRPAWVIWVIVHKEGTWKEMTYEQRLLLVNSTQWQLAARLFTKGKP